MEKEALFVNRPLIPRIVPVGPHIENDAAIVIIKRKSDQNGACCCLATAASATAAGSSSSSSSSSQPPSSSSSCLKPRSPSLQPPPPTTLLSTQNQFVLDGSLVPAMDGTYRQRRISIPPNAHYGAPADHVITAGD
jgi:hypothetical protein